MGITKANGWLPIAPDQHNDWVGQRDDSFADFISVGDKKDATSVCIFANHSRGAETGRDAWCYHFSKSTLASNMNLMISFYNNEVTRYENACLGLNKAQRPNIDNFVNTDSAKISWTSSLKNDASRFIRHEFSQENLGTSLYRPYSKQWTYFGPDFTHRVGQMPRIFPYKTVKNRVISVTGLGTPKDFSALMTDVLPDIQLQANGQNFPLKIYEEKSTVKKNQSLPGMGEETEGCDTFVVKDAAALLAHIGNLDDQSSNAVSKRKVVLVGHSMGGLVARAFVTLHDGHKFVSKVVALGTPNNGTLQNSKILEYYLAWGENIAGKINFGYSKSRRSAMQLLGTRGDAEWRLNLSYQYHF